MDEFKDINSLSASLETPDLLSLQNKAFECVTGISMPGSIHFGTNTDGNNTFTGKVNFLGLVGLESSYNFNTKETNTSLTVRNPLCPFYTTSIDKEGITKSLSIGPFSVSRTDKFSDPRTLKNMYNDILSEKGLYMAPDEDWMYN